jgi:hypothetical protein
MRLIEPARSNPRAIRRERMDDISEWNYSKTFAILSLSSRLAWLRRSVLEELSFSKGDAKGGLAD